MATIKPEVLSALVASLATCGGDRGPMLPVAKAIRGSAGGELREIVPDILHPLAENSITHLEREAIEGEILLDSVLFRYGSPAHFEEMKKEASNESLVSVAAEISAEIRPLAHTLLPLKNGIYENRGKRLALKGLVPLGPQDGQLVAHLAGVFSLQSPKSSIQKLLVEQAECPELVTALDSVSTIDYEGTSLREATLRAKDILGL